jgi:SAM-dependent methyltransferase
MGREKTLTQIREQRAKEAITYLKLTCHNPKSGLLLDLGCGLGCLTRYFLKLDIEAIGVDISGELIKSAKKIAPTRSFILADGVNLPFRKESFNTVILNDVLEHAPYNLENPILNEIRNALKVGGKLYISVMNRYQIREPHTSIPFLTWLPKPHWNLVYKLTKKRPAYDYYPYTVKKLEKLCGETGLIYKNCTWFYAWNKVSNVERIRNPIVKKMVKAIRKLKLSKLAYLIAEKMSIIPSPLRTPLRLRNVPTVRRACTHQTVSFEA